MEKTSDYMSVIEESGTLDRLLRAYGTTVALNNYLATRTYFQFPVVTNDSVEDIVDYYLNAIEVDQPDEAEYDESRLGKFIESGFRPRSIRYGEAISRLMSDRSRGVRGTPLAKYITHLLKLVYERDGPWVLSDYCHGAVGAVRPGTGSLERVYELFHSLGLTDGLVYCTIPVPNRAQLVERVTDKAAQDYKYFKWFFPKTIVNRRGVNAEIVHLCKLMSLVKLVQYSPSYEAFRRKFRTYSELGHNEEDKPEDYVSVIFNSIVMLCSFPPHVVDIDYTRYLHYMIKALAYTEEIYGVRVVDLLAEGDIGEEEIRALRMLANSK